jgi:hypothetical protein
MPRLFRVSKGALRVSGTVTVHMRSPEGADLVFDMYAIEVAQAMIRTVLTQGFRPVAEHGPAGDLRRLSQQTADVRALD